MTNPYPPVPYGVAPNVPTVGAEFKRMNHDIREAVRGYPQVTTPESVTAVTILNSPWTNFGTPFAVAAYRVMGTSVCLRGLVQCSAAVTGPSTIFNLPIRLRPANQEMFACGIGGSSTVRVDIYPNGDVAIGFGASTAANQFVSLSGVMFTLLP